MEIVRVLKPNRLVAGPWLGEFGWELMSWQALVRKAAQRYDDVYVCSREGHEPLYKDYCGHFIPHPIAGLKDCCNVGLVDQRQIRAVNDHLKNLGGDRLVPNGLIPIAQQSFIRFGSKERGKRLGYNFDIIVHARKPIGKRPGHSYPLNRWNELINRLHRYRIACIGTEAYAPEGTVDMRVAPMQDCMDAIASATMVLGPSSGPMHLASLCGTPHMVWTDTQFYSAINGTNVERYHLLWNPLRTPCRVLDMYGWLPSVDQLMRAIDEQMAVWRRS